MTSLAPRLPRAVLSLADLETSQLQRLIVNSAAIRKHSHPGRQTLNNKSHVSHSFLKHKSIALLFNKRSTRTRIAAEVAINRLGGHAMFLSDSDIQLGVNESLKDTAQVLSQLTSGIFARVGDHSEIEELAANSTVPVINALSSLWHPTQILADLLTIYDLAPWLKKRSKLAPEQLVKLGDQDLPPLTISYVGDSTNVLHDMMVAYPRLGHKLRVATPDKYKAPSAVWDRVREVGCESGIHWTNDPKEAVHGADFVVTDTWISMGQEAEKAERLQAFKGYQVTEQLCKDGGANPDWQFLHCLPRKPEEVDDEVFYGPRSHVFHEAGNRLPTIQALFQLMYKPSHISLSPKNAFKPRNKTTTKPAAS